MKKIGRLMSIFLIFVFLIVVIIGCGNNNTDNIKYIGLEKPENITDYHELADELMEEIDIDDYVYSSMSYEKSGVLTKRWELEKPTDENNKLDNCICFPTKNNWLIYNTFYRKVLQIDPSNVNETKDNTNKFLDFAETYLGKEKKVLIVSAPYIDKFEDYLFYHIGWETYIYSINDKKLLYNLSNLRYHPTKFCFLNNKLFVTNGVDGIHRFSVIDLKDGSTTTIEGTHDYVYKINNNVWVKTRDNNLIKVDYENNSFSNVIFSLDGTESIFSEGIAKIYDTDQYGDYILGCYHMPMEHKYDDRWFHKGDYFNRYTTSTEKWIPYTIEYYFLLNPEKLDEIIYLNEDILGSMDARVKVLGSHFIVENDKVLKCINPFEQKDIWWINREDVGEQAKILWADERGVLVYSMTHKKLYCFE